MAKKKAKRAKKTRRRRPKISPQLKKNIQAFKKEAAQFEKLTRNYMKAVVKHVGKQPKALRSAKTNISKAAKHVNVLMRKVKKL